MAAHLLTSAWNVRTISLSLSLFLSRSLSLFLSLFLSLSLPLSPFPQTARFFGLKFQTRTPDNLLFLRKILDFDTRSIFFLFWEKKIGSELLFKRSKKLTREPLREMGSLVFLWLKVFSFFLSSSFFLSYFILFFFFAFFCFCFFVFFFCCFVCLFFFAPWELQTKVWLVSTNVMTNQRCSGPNFSKHLRVLNFLSLQSVHKTLCSQIWAIPENRGFQKMEIQFFPQEIIACRQVLAKSLSLYRWLQICQNLCRQCMSLMKKT